MAYQPNPVQALFIWNLLCAYPADGVLQTQTRPKLSATEREQLLDEGFLNLEERGTAKFLTLGDRAWDWAQSTKSVTLASSAVAAEVLESLLRRLLPFLEERQIALAELLPLGSSAPRAPVQEGGKATSKKVAKKVAKKAAKKTASKKVAKKATKKTASKKAVAKSVSTKSPVASRSRARERRATPVERIEEECLALAAGKRKTRVMLSALRRQLPDLDRTEVDQSLLALQDANRIVLYREDNSAALSEDDRLAALFINNEPRHLVMLEAAR